MFLIERVSNKIGHSVASYSKMDKDHEDIIIYGAFNLLQTIFSILLVAIFGFIFHVFYEALIVSFTVGILRKYSGGAHLTSPNRCAAIGVFISVGFGLIVVNLIKIVSFKFVLILFVMSLIYCYYFIYQLAPVDSKAKPIASNQKKQHLKRCSIIALSIMSVMIILLFLLYKIFETDILSESGGCMTLGILWQTFTLTKSGHKLLGKVDAVLTIKKGGKKNEK